VTAPTAARRVTPSAVLVLPADAPREQWLAERRKGIGSSDVANIVGVGYTSAYHTWLDKLGRWNDDDKAGEAALWGNLHEETIAQEWCRRNASVVRRVGLVAKQTAAWQMCTLDRRVLECPLNRDTREACALEIKTRSAFKADRWRHKQIPDDVLAQTAWQRIVTGYDHVHVAVLIGGNDYRQTVVRRDDELERFLLDAADEFWQVNVGRDRAPRWQLDKAEQLIRLDEQMHPDRVGTAQLDVDGVGDVMEYARASAAAGAADKERKRQAARLRELAEGRRVVTFGDRLAYSLDERSKDSVDLARLAEKHPDAYADCVRTTTYHQVTIAKEYRQ
jgi:putative phage-type endonuclease